MRASEPNFLDMEGICGVSQVDKNADGDWREVPILTG